MDVTNGFDDEKFCKDNSQMIIPNTQFAWASQGVAMDERSKDKQVERNKKN